MSVRLFVGNLPFDVTEAELREYFASVGPLSYVYFPTDRETGKRRGFAFVEFGDAAHAEQAIAKFNNQAFKGRTLAVNEARAREARPFSSPGAPRPMGPRPGPIGFGRPPGPGFGRPDFSTDAGPMDRSARGERRSRSFGPDAKPARNRRFAGRGRNEGAKKGPIRERVGGQVFGTLESPDDGPDEELQDAFYLSRDASEDEEQG